MKTIILFCALFVSFSSFAAVKSERPKLVLLLVIDQFRSDYLIRFQSRFLPAEVGGGKVGGFRFLTEKGAYYPFAEYEHLQCMTGPGHATLLTGAYPYAAGIPTNYWYDRNTHDRMYCTEDTKVKTVGVEKTRAHVGTSPANLKASTVGDEIKNSGYPGKVVSIAVKDRAAILMGGHRPDFVMWHDFDSFHWVTSDYYAKSLPDWVADLNKKLDAQTGQTKEWKTDGKTTGYSEAEKFSFGKDPSFGIGMKFPHEISANTKGILRSPFGVEMTVDAAIEAAKNFKLGKSQWTDLLAVSISSHDYLAHSHGPNSPEMEEMTVQEDRMISKLLNQLAAQVPGGIQNMTIILTADHGGGHVPEWLLKNRVDAGRIDEVALTAQTNEMLEKKFGKLSDDQKYVPYGYDFNQYLNHGAIEKKGISISEVESAIKEFHLKSPWVVDVLTSSDYQKRILPPAKKGDQVMKTYFANRSGDIYIFSAPNYIPAEDTASHLTGYAYDCTVPLIFKGAAFKPGKYSQKAHVVDLASTLSFVLGLTPPSLSEGRVLSEALK